ncbi:MAG: transcription/translation regulatory transformer protein RfaH [Thalassotalea sp.]|nr:transcription/translation regulatory transformer protein RfaH [Thalassotalea sp.]
MLAKDSNAQWFVLTSKPREEQRAFDNLTSQGYEAFLPKIAKVKKLKGIKAVSSEPLFPNYLFILLDKQVANFNAIRSTRGVGSFVRFGMNQATIDDSIIMSIKQSLNTGEQEKTLDELLNYSQGEKVEITTGPFKGLQAIYQTKDGLERSILMVKMLGQDNQVVVNNQEFEKSS